MSQTLAKTDNNGIVLFGPVPVNFITDTAVTLGTPANNDVNLTVNGVTVIATNVLGTLTVAGTGIVDTGTTGQNITSSTTFTSAVTNSYTRLAIPANAKVVTGNALTKYIRLLITAKAVGQATTTRQRLDNISTITTAAPHGFVAGDVVEVRSMTNTSYNGRFVVVSIPSPTQFTYYNVGTDEGTVADAAGRVGAFDALAYVWAQQLG